MKSTIQIVSALLFFTLFACGQQNDQHTTESDAHWKRYSDANCEIQYPEEWEVNTAGQMGTSFILLSPLEPENDQFRENVNLLIQDLQGQQLDLDTYVKLSENQVKTLITDGEILESERQKNSNGMHHKLVYNGKQGQLDLRFEQLFWVIDDKAYILTFTSEKEKFAMYRSMSEKIMNSFKMK
jgi:hypothetical protein